MSAGEDDLKGRLTILEERVRELERKNALLTTTIASALVAVFISFAMVFLLIPGLGTALVLTSGFLILLYILGRHRESSLRKSVEIHAEQR